MRMRVYELLTVGTMRMRKMENIGDGKNEEDRENKGWG